MGNVGSYQWDSRELSNGELAVNAAEEHCRGNPDDDGETGLCPGIS